MDFLKSAYNVVILNPIISGIISSIIAFIIIEIVIRNVKKFSIILFILCWFKNLLNINKLNTKVNALENKIAELEKQHKDIPKQTKEELEAECKKKWDNLDDEEKEELKKFKTKNTNILYIELPAVIGLLRNGIIQQIQNAYYSSGGILIASCRINPYYKEFLSNL
jgi:hypothetical protein